MTRITVILPKASEEGVKQLVEKGKFASKVEVIREAVRAFLVKCRREG